jgi:hypothetical protein
MRAWPILWIAFVLVDGIQLINPKYFFCCLQVLSFSIHTLVQCHTYHTPHMMNNFYNNFCEACGRPFSSNKALQQHLRDSPVHKPTFNSNEAPQQRWWNPVVPKQKFYCEICNNSFSNNEALQWHLQYSIAHKQTFDCETCNNSFSSNKALQWHLQYSIIHGPAFYCETCEKGFGSEEALQQHLRESPMHKQIFGSEETPQQRWWNSAVPKPNFNCETCDTYFGSEEAFQQHLQNSREHRLLFYCDTCAQSFGTLEVLDQHIQNSPVHSLEVMDQHMQNLSINSRPRIWCNTCDRSFRSDEALHQHFQSSRVHQIEWQNHDIETKPIVFEMFPELHQDVLDAISGAMISPRFNHNDDDDSFDGADNKYSTHVIGDFTCSNYYCGLAWPSKRVTIVIRRYPGYEYNAAVYYQRCKSCNSLGDLYLDENSYVERVTYRLIKWAGVAVKRPFYDERTSPPHISELCEGCIAGYCQNDTVGRGFET